MARRSGEMRGEKLVAGAIGIKWCPETESNRHVLLRTRDFKSRASASFAIRADSKPLKRIYQLTKFDFGLRVTTPES